MITKERALWIYRKMLEIRSFEETAWTLFCENKIHGSVHLYLGEEAIAASVCSYMTDEDCITSTHRGHGHCIAKGGNLGRTLAEMMGKDTGYCRGRSGSMHIADFSKGNLGANAIVGGGVPIAVGAALSMKMQQKKDRFVVSFFGDGACSQGTAHESMNLAALWKLPLIFCVENNGYAISLPLKDNIPTQHITDRAAAYGMPGYSVDGNDVEAICEAMEKALAHVLAGEGPVLLECRTGRWMGHWTGDPELYRTREEVEALKRREPIGRFRKRMLEEGLADEAELTAIEEAVKQDMAAALAFAENSPEPDPAHVTDDVFFEG
jgi:pyruvate dehydrogenase E1 component alpha subunit